MTTIAAAHTRANKLPRTIGARLKELEPLHGTDILLAAVFGLTLISLTLTVAGHPISPGDLLLLPVLLIAIASPDSGRLPGAYAAFTIIYLVWAILSIGWSADPTSALGVLQYVEFFLLVPLAFVHVRNLRGVLTIINFYVLLASLLAAAVLVYAIATRTFSYLYFLDYQKNHLGAVMANAIPLIVALLILSPGARKRYWVALTLTSLALLFSSSRGSMLGVLVGLACFVLLVRRIKFGVAAILVGGAFVLAYATWIDPEALTSLSDFGSGTSAGSRILIFDNAMAFIAQSPYVGQGVGSYIIRIPSIGFQQQDPSNLFLLNLAEVGVVGLVIFVIILLLVIAFAIGNSRRFTKSWTYTVLSAALSAAFIGHIAHAQIDVSWIRGIGTFVFACVAMMMKLRQLHDEAPADFAIR